MIGAQAITFVKTNNGKKRLIKIKNIPKLVRLGYNVDKSKNE